MKKVLICGLLIAVAFGIGYGWAYLKLRDAEKKWSAANQEMQGRITALERDLAVAQARVTLWETPLSLSQISLHIAEKNFGLATKAIDQLRDSFSKAQSQLSGEWQGKFDFVLPALDEIKKEVQNLNPNARANTDDLKNRFEQTLKSFKTSG